MIGGSISKCSFKLIESTRKMRIYFKTATNPVATEAFKVGETGESPKKTSKRADVTLFDSIVASTPVGRPSTEMLTCNSHATSPVSEFANRN